MNKAIIDLGTNTFHLLITRSQPSDNGSFEVLHDQKTGVRLGAGGNMKNKIISPQAADRALECLHNYAQIAKKYQIEPDQICAVGTSALRNANNAADFADTVQRQTGISIRIIDGYQELLLVWNGVCLSLDPYLQNQTILTIDIGGGSIEMIIGHQKTILWAQSFETGGLRLLEMAESQDPFSPETKARLGAWLRNSWPGLTAALATHKPTILLGAAGMFETLAQLYAHQSQTLLPSPCAQIPYSFFESLNQKISHLDLEQRNMMPGMIELRAAMVPAAVLILENLFELSGIRQFFVSDYGLKEGVLMVNG